MAPNDFSGAKPILLLFLANFNFRAVALIVWLLQVFEIFQNTLFFFFFFFFFFFEVQNFAISETKGRIKNLMAPNDFSGAKPILLLFLANFNFRAVALIVWLLQVFEIFQNTLFFKLFFYNYFFIYFFTPMLQQAMPYTHKATTNSE